MLFQDQRYLDIQQYVHHESFNDSGFTVQFSIQGQVAMSQSKSPFGGILMKQPKTEREFASFWKECEKGLLSHGVRELHIIQPPSYYRQFVPISWLTNLGFSQEISERNQFVDLTRPPVIHPMELRILRKQRVTINTGDLKDLGLIHTFIAHCRKNQGLEVNISVEKLNSLFQAFPDRYFILNALENDTLVSTCIFCSPTADVIYYFLPATDPEHKEGSPMVPLLHWSYGYFQKLGFKIMDLGISSIKGQDQEGLVAFKERMGAQSTARVTLGKRF